MQIHGISISDRIRKGDDLPLQRCGKSMNNCSATITLVSSIADNRTLCDLHAHSLTAKEFESKFSSRKCHECFCIWFPQGPIKLVTRRIKDTGIEYKYRQKTYQICDDTIKTTFHDAYFHRLLTFSLTCHFQVIDHLQLKSAQTTASQRLCQPKGVSLQ